MKSKVVITDWGFPSLDPEREVLTPLGVEVEAFQCKTEDDVVRVVAGADVVMAQWAPVREKAISAMGRCKGIVRYGIGLDNIDLDVAAKKGIPVRNVPDYCLDEVADHTMALLLSLQRQVTSVFQQVKAGVWKITPPLALLPLRQSTLGLVGFGRIARLVALRARSFGLRIVAYDPMANPSVFAETGVGSLSLERVLAESDIVSLHCPLTPETKHIINTETLKKMKPSSLLVNTSRGGLVETDAVVEALRRGDLAGAALDVFEQEPLPQDHPFLTLSTAIATSHNAWYSSASVGQLQRKAALAALELLQRP
ncbi:MAG TPA: C-terminal binding protein [Bacteroidota bacterium]|nr:C-terminal binding protein [Bacteroidota bacterium]